MCMSQLWQHLVQTLLIGQVPCSAKLGLQEYMFHFQLSRFESLKFLEQKTVYAVLWFTLP